MRVSPLLLALALIGACSTPGAAPRPEPVAAVTVVAPCPSVAAAAAPAEPVAPAATDVAMVSVVEGIVTFRDAPVHPGAVHELCTSIADRFPINIAIDLDGAMRANRFYKPARVGDGRVKLHDDELLGKDGEFQYELVGVTPRNTYALRTWSSAGGSGVFMNVLLVRFEADVERNDEGTRERVLMKRVGELSLGDRDDGDIRLEGDKLTLGKSRYREQELEIHID